PEVFVCATDQIAMAVIDTVSAAGIQVPAGVAVTGFDGILAALVGRHRLTTVRQPMEEIGRAAVRKLVSAIQGAGDRAAATAADQRLRLTLLIGSSCGCDPVDYVS